MNVLKTMEVVPMFARTHQAVMCVAVKMLVTDFMSTNMTVLVRYSTFLPFDRRYMGTQSG